MHCFNKGTPQGGVIFPLLANLYLNWLDRNFYGPAGPGTWAKARLVRYADDFVILARFIDNRIEGWVERIVEDRFRRLELDGIEFGTFLPQRGNLQA